jgi:hypothetical protein
VFCVCLDGTWMAERKGSHEVYTYRRRQPPLRRGTFLGTILALYRVYFPQRLSRHLLHVKSRAAFIPTLQQPWKISSGVSDV